MAIDFLILALLLISFVINFLALSAFWVTPGLRTTANRFTINLLIINVIGCLILAPTLFLGSATTSTTVSAIRTKTRTTLPNTADISNDSIEFLTKADSKHVSIRHNRKLIKLEGIIERRNHSNVIINNANNSHNADETTVETVYKCNATNCREIIIRRGSKTVVITEIDEENVEESYTLPTPPLIKPHLWEDVRMRCWTIDLAAALGALAVLLVVGDTWCAVTDPLRYHSRISGVKSWVFIALVWTGGIFFGILSAFRELDINFESDIVYSRRNGIHETDHFSLASGHNIFALIFAYLYFLIIILLPFGFVCGMYWRIFSEARGNGLRMRQNGSSPLLQSALNLMHHQQQQQQQHQQQLVTANNLCVHRNSVSSASSNGGTIVGGLQMNIDQQHQQPQQQKQRNSPACLRRDSAAKVLLPTISDDGVSDDADDSEVESTTGHLMSVPECRDRNQNILLTLQTASGEIKRNYSARQLPLLGNSSFDFHETVGLQGMRQVHSSPNLQKYSIVGDEHNSSQHLDPNNQHNSRLHKPNHHQLHQHHHQFHSHRQQVTQTRLTRQALQIPAIHSSPKALGYMSSLRHRLSNASSLFKYREESRAARISILVVIMFLVSYLPYGFLVLMQSHLPAANFKHSTQLAIFMLLLGNMTSPIIFAYRNKRVRRGIKRLCWMTQEGSLQRQSSSSMRGSGFLRRQSSSCGAIRAAVRRNDSRMSTYSNNSCKMLSQQNSMSSNNTQCGVHATLSLRPNHSCSTFINFSLPKGETEMEKLPEFTQEIKTRPVLQRGITIVEHIPVTPKFSANRNLLKMFFKSSKRLSCTSGQACGGGREPELTEV